jgi:hypothetical protein
MSQVDDLSRSLTAFDQDNTLVAVAAGFETEEQGATRA